LVYDHTDVSSRSNKRITSGWRELRVRVRHFLTVDTGRGKFLWFRGRYSAREKYLAM
jgi:hypothetical protein